MKRSWGVLTQIAEESTGGPQNHNFWASPKPRTDFWGAGGHSISTWNRIWDTSKFFEVSPTFMDFTQNFDAFLKKNSLHKPYLDFSRGHFGTLKLKIGPFLRSQRPPEGNFLRWFWGKKCLDLKTTIFELAQIWGQIFGVLEGTE